MNEIYWALLGSHATGLAVGYVLGRGRPWKNAQDWAAWEFLAGRITTRRKAVLLLALSPRDTARAVWKYLRGERAMPVRPTASEPVTIRKRKDRP